jgi:hypothetical protein
VSARKQIAGLIGLALLLIAFLVPSGAQAAFGIKSFSTPATNRDGTADFQAGSHPFEYTVDFAMNQDANERPEGTLRDLIVKLPPGLVGNPEAVPRCTGAQFEGLLPKCPGDTQIGVVHFSLAGISAVFEFPVFNLAPPAGVPGMLGFAGFSANSFQEARVRSDDDYGLDISDITIPTFVEIQFISETIWGVPADPRHDAERECLVPGGGYELGCASDVPPAPYLSLPTSCGEPLESTLSVDSVQNPGVFDTKTVLSEEEGTPAGMDGCNAVEFEPEISSQPTTTLADSPTGLDFDLHQPQNQDPEGLSTAHLKDATVTLPEGMTINPSVANGLAVCSEDQIGLIGTGFPAPNPIHFSKNPQSCPNASKLGTVEVKTPLLNHKLEGGVYLAKPYDNPFGSFMGLYLAVEDEQTGIVAKLAGEVVPDPQTGQLTTTFTENPQLPLEDVELHLFNGPKAALKTPLTCGTYTTTSTMVPWSTPEGETVHPSDPFQTSVAAGGSGACPSTEAGAPNKPSFTAGTIAPQAGAYTPFVLKIARQDGSQRIRQIDTTLPKGLTGKLAGIPYCPEAAIAQAKSREAPNQGATEQAHPSCPAASEVGTATVGAGAGVTPYYTTGHAYLAGPYKGAPLSMVIITPAVAGPFDLGAVVVRTPFYVDPETAKIHAVSDPLPWIIQGVPLDIRSIALSLARPSFTLNPTSCDPMQVLGSTTSTLGSLASLESPFQVGGCKALGFSPKLNLSLKGGTKRGRFPALKAVLTYPQGSNYANTASAQVTLPHGEFIEQAHFKTICTNVQFKANACPAGAIYGKAKAITPLLEAPVEGPVYLRSSTHKLPDLVISLKGQVNADLVGRIDTGKNKGLRTTFEAAPDVPVSKVILEMQGGKKGLLVNSENLCSKEQRAIADLTAQNGKVSETNPLVHNDCKGGKAKKKAHKGGKGHGGKR